MSESANESDHERAPGRRSAGKSPLRVGIVSSRDVKDPGQWSGITAFIVSALEDEFEHVTPLGPVARPGILKLYAWLMHVFFRLTQRRGYLSPGDRFTVRYWGYVLGRRLRKTAVDVIVAPAAAGEVAFLQTDTPICYISDASFTILYETYSGAYLSPFSEREQRVIERRCIANSNLQIFASDWAADFVRESLSSEKPNAHVLPFGANLKRVPAAADLTFRRSEGPIRLLFVGVDWARKGGVIVLETLDLLKNDGYEVELTVVGCTPPVSHDDMTVIPFVDKNSSDGANRMSSLLLSSDFMFVPSRAECYGIVFAEAGAYGLPSVSCDSGGISTVVKNDQNGYLLRHDAPASSYAKVMAMAVDDPDTYQRLSRTARALYEAEYNWQVFGSRLRVLLEGLIAN